MPVWKNFLSICIYLLFYLFIYSHLFNNTATSVSIVLLKKRFMLTFLENPVFCVRHQGFWRKMLKPTTTHSIQLLFCKYSALILSFLNVTEISLPHPQKKEHYHSCILHQHLSHWTSHTWHSDKTSNINMQQWGLRILVNQHISSFHSRCEMNGAIH